MVRPQRPPSTVWDAVGAILVADSRPDPHTRLDCSGAPAASQVLDPIFYRRLAVTPTGTITSDNIGESVPKRDLYREGAKVYEQSRRFFGFVVPAVMKPARTLWHQI